ncbi:MAG TPA: SpoIIE family protein phosphatase, partial [Verrucomicrobiota bacterium]|nr:SpoIIE family protein phosphatase [Verrucomicrobiota bacterium]
IAAAPDIAQELAIAPGAEIETFVRAQTVIPRTPFVVIVGADGERTGREALRLGAQDFLFRPELTAAALALAIRKAADRYSAQAAWRRDRHLLEILMDMIPDAIYFKDTESRFLRISQAQAKRFNLPDPAMAIGRTDADFFSGAHAQQARADEEYAMRTGQPLVGIEEMETWPDGSVTWVSTTKMPLRDASGAIIGTFGISRDITSRKLAELALAERTHQLQQKNQQIEEELRMARELQQAMLPQQFPCVPPNPRHENSALEFHHYYSPSGSVSGDFFDVVELSDTAVGVFICDVMGHDVRAALVTAMVRSLVEDVCHTVADPGELLAHINRALAAVFKQTGATMFATAFYAIMDVATGELRYASAAHPDALHVRRNQNRVEPLSANNGRKGPAIGLFEEALFPTCGRRLEPNDLVILFTDGLTEAQDASGDCFSQERLLQAVARRVHERSGDLIAGMVGEARQFCRGTPFHDDVSILGVEVKRLVPAARAREARRVGS